MKLTPINGSQVRRVLSVSVIVLPLCFGAWIIQGNSAHQRQRSSRTRKKTTTLKKPKTDYTNFSHQTHFVAQKLACDSCHKVPAKNWNAVRTGDAAFQDVTDFPEHDSCLNCHRQQFFARERPAPTI